MEYTKGEWKFNRKYAPKTHGIKVSDDLFSSITSSDTVICFLPEPHYMPDMGDRTWYKGCVENMEANAQLIAAAPDMYEALKELARLLPPKTPEDSRLILKAEKALAKAGVIVPVPSMPHTYQGRRL